MSQINKKSYVELIQLDIEKLNQFMPEESLERKHIEVVLNWSIKALYPQYECTSKAVKDGYKHCNICSGKSCQYYQAENNNQQLLTKTEENGR